MPGSSKFYSTQAPVNLRVKEAREEANIGKEINVKGWVKSIRKQKSVNFIEINDGSSIGNAQVVIDGEELLKKLEPVLQNIGTGCSVSVNGKLIKSLGKNQKTELVASTIELIGRTTDDYPLQKKGHSIEFLREISHLRPRSNSFGAVLRIRNAATHAIHNYFQNQGFIQVHTPVLTSSDCEGAGELFKVVTDVKIEDDQTVPKKNFDAPTAANNSNNNEASSSSSSSSSSFFGCDAFLSVSGQLQAEIFACALSRVYTFGPAFRAENSNTNRHLSEFWMLEPEIAHADMDTNIAIAEGCVRRVVSDVMEQCHEDLHFLQQFVDKGLMKRLEDTVSARPFERITYTEAIDILSKSNKKFQFPFDWGCNLKSEHERYLCEEHFGNRPLFVTDYPKDIKPFYAKMNDDGKTVGAVDLLVPRIGELIGGSVREERYEYLHRAMQEKQMDVSRYQWYLDLRRYGTVPHAGWGMGFERMIMYLTGMDNIRDVIPVPRAPGLCKF